MIQKSIKQMGLLKNAQSSGPIEESVTCVFCETKITSISAIRNHVLNDHKPTEDEKGKDDDDFQQDLIQHGVSCDACGKQMFDNWSLKRHIQ